METESARRRRFEQLFDDHYGRVLAYAQRRVPSDVAQDVVAQTFVTAWRRLEAVPEPPLPWLYGVARRVLANELRAGRRRAALADRAVASVIHRTPDQGSPLLAALARLGRRDRDVLLLTAWEGLASHEAAAALGCSQAAVRVRLHRARRRLAAELERDADSLPAFAAQLEEQP